METYIIQWTTPSFCPRRTDELSDCPRQSKLSNGSKKLHDIIIACRKCKTENVDTKTNPQNHPIGYGDLFQCPTGEVIKI